MTIFGQVDCHGQAHITQTNEAYLREGEEGSINYELHIQINIKIISTDNDSSVFSLQAVNCVEKGRNYERNHSESALLAIYAGRVFQ